MVGRSLRCPWVLSSYVILWSISTALLGWAGGLASLFVLRLACGLFEAGAYVCSRIVRTWVPPQHRGFASGIVAVGGRLGGAAAPLLTMKMMVLWTYGAAGWSMTDAEPAHTSWRPVLILYGVVGIVIALIFMWLYRDDPDQHRWSLRKNYRLLARGASLLNIGQRKHGAQPVFPLKGMLTSYSLWLMSFVQFASNFGWVFW